MTIARWLLLVAFAMWAVRCLGKNYCWPVSEQLTHLRQQIDSLRLWSVIIVALFFHFTYLVEDNYGNV